MRLVYFESQEEVKVGDVVHLSRVPHIVLHFRPPHKPSSSGKVTVQSMDGFKYVSEYFVGVIGAVWVEREDRDYEPEDLMGEHHGRNL